jgi:hypothetical protein
MNIKKVLKLLVSIVIDVIGFLTYSIPALGELGDVVWAPVSSILVYFLYKSNLIAMGNFAEEILPGTDFIPTATIGNKNTLRF